MLKKTNFNIDVIDASWHLCIKNALSKMDPAYLAALHQSSHWLPGPEKIFNAFSIPVSRIKYVLFGESPYPRATSANGYAFWDAAVNELWSAKGLSIPVNRATSLRNIIKMLLVGEGLLNPGHTSQENIAALNKNNLIITNHELFGNLLNQGFLLLNATMVLQPDQVAKDAKAWFPFIQHILEFIYAERGQDICLILLGNIAKKLNVLIEEIPCPKIFAEHPYNVSFITNPDVIAFFKPFNLLKKQAILK